MLRGALAKAHSAASSLTRTCQAGDCTVPMGELALSRLGAPAGVQLRDGVPDSRPRMQTNRPLAETARSSRLFAGGRGAERAAVPPLNGARAAVHYFTCPSRFLILMPFSVHSTIARHDRPAIAAHDVRRHQRSVLSPPYTYQGRRKHLSPSDAAPAPSQSLGQASSGGLSPFPPFALIASTDRFDPTDGNTRRADRREPAEPPPLCVHAREHTPHIPWREPWGRFV